MSKNQVNCLRCYKNNALEGYIYCKFCMEHFPQCKGQKKMIFKSKKQKETEKNIITKEIKKLSVKLKELKQQLKNLGDTQ